MINDFRNQLKSIYNIIGFDFTQKLKESCKKIGCCRIQLRIFNKILIFNLNKVQNNFLYILHFMILNFKCLDISRTES